MPVISAQHSLHPLSVVLPAIFDRLAAPVYSLILWIALVFVQESRVHSRLVWHLFIVSVLSAVHEYLFVIGPSLILTDKHYSPESTELYSLSLTVLTIIATGTIRTGPEVFRERHRLYTPAVTNKLKEVGESVQSNVIGSGDSVIGSFMSVSAFRLMRQVSACDQVDVHELPVLPASMQTEPTTIDIDPQSDDSVSRFGYIVSLIMEIVKPQRVLYMKRELSSFRRGGAFTHLLRFLLCHAGGRPCLRAALLSSATIAHIRRGCFPQWCSGLQWPLDRRLGDREYSPYHQNL